MSLLSVITGNSRPGQAGQFIHAEHAKHEMIITVSVIWMLVGALFSLQEMRGGVSDREFGEYLLMFLPFGGFILLVYGCRLIYMSRRLGELLLQIPGTLQIAQKNVPVTLFFSKGLGQAMRRPATPYSLALEVICIHEDNSGDGTSTKTLWSQKIEDMHIPHGTRNADFVLDIPANLPASGKLGLSDINIVWKLQVRVLGAKVGFVLPVKSALAACD